MKDQMMTNLMSDVWRLLQCEEDYVCVCVLPPPPASLWHFKPPPPSRLLSSLSPTDQKFLKLRICQIPSDGASKRHIQTPDAERSMRRAVTEEPPQPCCVRGA